MTEGHAAEGGRQDAGPGGSGLDREVDAFAESPAFTLLPVPAFTLLPVPAWIFDHASLRFLAVNDAAVERYGWSRAEFLAMTVADIRPAEDVAAMRRTIANLRAPNVGAPNVGADLQPMA